MLGISEVPVYDAEELSGSSSFSHGPRFPPHAHAGPRRNRHSRNGDPL
ncbi:MAG: hypothetical protein IH623_29200 [Verrucomicrobia bacterium]|nr:hypothetical protein [Verrucomicrobiota bacterium]